MAEESNNKNIVHESEMQRRHSRVKIPSSLVYVDEAGAEHKLPILDLSATGCSFSSEAVSLEAGSFAKGRLVFKFDALEIGLDIKFQVVGIYGNEPRRFGCEFHDLGREEIATLRTIITKFLSGEVTNVNDILSTLSRDNFAKARQDDVSKALTGSERFRALIFTAAFVGISLMAFAYVLLSIHEHFFVVEANTAVVRVDSSRVSANRNGSAEVLVQSGELVKAGQPIAVIRSPLVSDLSGIASGALMEDDDLSSLLEQTVSSSITSPCDCRVREVNVAPGDYVVQGQQLAVLSGQSAQATVYARFDYSVLPNISIGESVVVILPDGESTINGVISSLRVPEAIFAEEHKVHAILATIQTDTPLDNSLANQPVMVRVGELNFN